MFCLNVFKDYHAESPGGAWATLMEALSGTAVAATVFLVFTLLLIAFVHCCNDCCE